MRKIEAQMVMAVRDQLSGSEKTWRSGNTEVSTEHRGVHGTFNYDRDVVVRLHGNEIARFDSMLEGDRAARGLAHHRCRLANQHHKKPFKRVAEIVSMAALGFARSKVSGC